MNAKVSIFWNYFVYYSRLSNDCASIFLLLLIAHFQKKTFTVICWSIYRAGNPRFFFCHVFSFKSFSSWHELKAFWPCENILGKGRSKRLFLTDNIFLKVSEIECLGTSELWWSSALNKFAKRNICICFSFLGLFGLGNYEEHT